MMVIIASFAMNFAQIRNLSFGSNPRGIHSQSDRNAELSTEVSLPGEIGPSPLESGALAGIEEGF